MTVCATPTVEDQRRRDGEPDDKARQFSSPSADGGTEMPQQGGDQQKPQQSREQSDCIRQTAYQRAQQERTASRERDSRGQLPTPRPDR